MSSKTESEVRAEARRDAFNEAASIDAQVIAMLLADGKIQQIDVDQALLRVKAMRGQTGVVGVWKGPLAGDVPLTPRLLDKQEVALMMQSEGLVMVAPCNGARTCELIKIGSDTVQYHCPAGYYDQAQNAIAMLGTISLFVHVPIKEPDHVAVWAIVAASNKTALQFRCDPAFVPNDPDDTDEGDDIG